MSTDRSVLNFVAAGAFAIASSLFLGACGSLPVDPAVSDIPAPPVAGEGDPAGAAGAARRSAARPRVDGESSDVWSTLDGANPPDEARLPPDWVKREGRVIHGRHRPQRMTVAEVVDEALDGNRGVTLARISSLVGKENQRESFSRLLPQLRWQGSWSLNEDVQGFNIPGDDPGGDTGFATSPKDQFNSNFNLDFPIFGFGRYVNSYRSAKARAQQADAERELTESDIATAVTGAAYELLVAQRGLDVAIEQEQAFKRQVLDSQALLEAGRVTREAVLDATLQYERARRDRQRVESVIPVRRMNLNRLLGRPPHDPIEVVDAPSQRAPTWRVYELEEIALAQRADLRSARLGIEAAHREYLAVVGRELPELRGNVNAFATDNPFLSPSNNITFNLTLDVPIFTGGARGARIRRARHETEAARIRAEQLEDDIRTEVFTAHREVVEQFRDLAVAKRSIESATESLRIQREKFNQGRSTSLEVLTATASLTNTKVEYLEALYAYNIAMHELQRVTGGDPREMPTPPSAEEGGGPPPDIGSQLLTGEGANGRGDR